MLLLVKALAKYYGSYDSLSRASLAAISTLLFGSVPFDISVPAFTKVYDEKYPIGLST